MSSSHTQAEWDRLKNSIQDLYVRQGLSLSSTMEQIEDRGFYATKSQYENQIRKWKLRKRSKGEDWKTLSYKIEKRKQQGKDTFLYFEGSLMPERKRQKELSRQGYLSFRESLQWAEVLQNDLQLGSHLGYLPFDKLVSRLNSLLPISALRDETLVSELAIEAVDRMTPRQSFGIMAFLLSNNCPIDIKPEQLYKWFKNQKIFDQRLFRLPDNPSLEALMESVFCYAVEEQDVPTVSGLIKAGANPNINRCRFWELPIPLTPLQFACIKGSLTLVNVLLRANAEVNNPEPGWRCNILLLAIRAYGNQETYFSHRDWGRDRGDRLVTEMPEEGMSKIDLWVKAESREERTIEALVRTLIDFRANVNHLEQDDIARAKILQKYTPQELHSGNPEAWFYPLVVERNSPLTLASRHRATKVVELLIQAGANVHFNLEHRCTAVEQCFYSGYELHKIREFLKSKSQQFLHQLSLDDLDWKLESTKLSRYRRSHRVRIAVLKILGAAGASFTNHEVCHAVDECQHDNFECCSILDFAICFGATTEETEAMLALGAVPSIHSLEVALRGMSFSKYQLLVKSGAPIPNWAESWYDEKIIPAVQTRTKAERAELVFSLRQQRAMILGAIHLSDAIALETLLSASAALGPSILKGVDCGKLTMAIENCSATDDGSTLRCLIESNVLDGFGQHVFGSSLARAISSASRSAIEVLLAAGADVNRGFTRFDGLVESPLSAALRHSAMVIIDRLLDRMAHIVTNPDDPFLQHDTSSEGNLLIKAINKKDKAIIQRFLDAKLSLEAFGRVWGGKKRYSPLAIAIETEQWSLFDILQDSGADIHHPAWDLSNADLVTPLRAAVKQGNVQLSLSLIKLGAGRNDLEALNLAVKQPKTSDSELIISELSKDMAVWNAIGIEFSWLWLIRVDTCSEKRQKAVRMIVDSHADLNYLFDYEYYGYTQSTILLEILEAEDFESAQILLNAGASVEFYSEACVRHTPLQLTCALSADMQMIRLLLRFGCSPNHIALWAEGQQRSQRGESWLSQRRYKAAPLQAAAAKDNLEVVRLLPEHGAQPDITSEHTKQIALQLAVQNGNMDMMNLLLEYGADVNATATGDGGTIALQLAAERGYLGIAKLLVEKGADVNASGAGIRGYTALEAAAANGRLDFVQFLKNAGVDISRTAGQYERALSLAYDHGYWALRRELLTWLS
ncbi:MAG: hypothetical protein M1822_005998 [Bathelium mastoideum]|nr:MAG: hypothetical protein M1822_005998 [Bathelium mastoideum]